MNRRSCQRGNSDFGVLRSERRDRKNDVAPMSMLQSLRRACSRIFGTLGVSMKPYLATIRMKWSETRSIETRSCLATLGVSTVRIESRMLRSCMTRLCFRLCIIDVGAA